MQDPSAAFALLQQQSKQQMQFPVPAPEQEQLRCPRCDSANTKFCYYNNYNLSQPRHFCKSCRRYWTKGGALRNIPVGGGSRKTSKRPSSAAKRPSAPPPTAAGPSGQEPDPKPEPGLGIGPGELGFPVGGFTSLLASNGQFGSLLEGMGPVSGSGPGPGLGSSAVGGGGAAEGLLGELQSGWPDRAIYTPGSRFQ